MARTERTEVSELRKGRARLGLTQAAMAARLGISLGWYALVEREPSFLSERLARRAAALLGCAEAELRACAGEVRT